jgi:DNA-directed RNA polymerase subunit beta
LSDLLNYKTKRHSFSSVDPAIDYPDFLDIQLQSFRKFFQVGSSAEERPNEGLYSLFKSFFPISDSKGNFIIDFVDYSLGLPQYDENECIARGCTYAAPLKVKLKLSCTDDSDDFVTVEQDIYFGDIPYMTSRGSFIFNGIERVIVSQIHKSPGVFFSQVKHSSGITLYSSKVIPFKGLWIEFTTDVNDLMYVYIDRKKKISITVLLRAIGYSTDKSILEIFDLAHEVDVTRENLSARIGQKLAARILKKWTEEFVDEDTGELISVDRNEIILERDTVLTEETIEMILNSSVEKIVLHKGDIAVSNYKIIYNTLHKDETNSEKEAIDYIYRQLRNIDAPDEQTAYETFSSIFFNSKRYDLGKVGRYRINKRLGLTIPEDVNVLTKEDIIAIIKCLIDLSNSKSYIDDIDHLSNRRIKLIGEQLQNNFALGLARVVRILKDRINVRDEDDLKPVDLINVKALGSVLNAFFTANPLSQFMDQLNPLAEVAHKRRISALGPGGLSRNRAGFEVRDIHYTHYGRLCPIETPEGPNIGLISSLSMYAKVNDLGFIETPYRKVIEGKVDVSENNIHYLTAEEERGHTIAQANVPIDAEGNFLVDKIQSRVHGDFDLASPSKISYMDVAPNQIVSVAAALIPFLEHDDASRALMGSNMQRQAVPLLKPESPIVGTGLESRVARDFNGIVYAEDNGVVEYVDANKIVVSYDSIGKDSLTTFSSGLVVYKLSNFRGTNQETCIQLRPIVLKGQKVVKGQCLCDGYAINNGELALGKNLLVAYMSWKGYTFEDAIVISERVVKDDTFTSIHIEEFDLDVRSTKIGEEEFTSEIPNVSDEAIKNLDENGIVRVGARVKEGDIIIGKVAPKGETDPTPEEKLLRAIFGDKAHDVKDVSLKAPPSLEGIVIKVKYFTRASKDKESRELMKKEISLLVKLYSEKLNELKKSALDKLSKILKGEKSKGIFNILGEKLVAEGVELTQKNLNDLIFSKKNIQGVEPNSLLSGDSNILSNIVIGEWTDNEKKNTLVRQLIKNYNFKHEEILAEFKRSKFAIEVGDDLPVGVLKLAKVYIAKKRKLKVGDKMAGRHGNKGIVSKIVPEADMPFLEDGTPVDIVLNPLSLTSRMNLGQLYESMLGWAGLKLGKKYATPVFDGASINDISKELKKAGLPQSGTAALYDGLTGEAFDQKVTIGVTYMMKLGHLIDDKIHARSIGPYSLVTQQPLGGKSHFGGQRFGEMEVWALEAFGAANILREMLTIKSDDVIGRSNTYEAIVKGKNVPEPNMPESFKVLVHELRGMGLNFISS